jgi:hypothetical protein
LALEPQRGKADVGQREDIGAAIGLQMLLVDELTADTLNLPLQRYLSVVQVKAVRVMISIIPGDTLILQYTIPT